MDLKEAIIQKARSAKEASREMVKLTTAAKDQALKNIISAVDSNREKIKKENKKDIEAAETKKMPKALVDRLTLNDKRIDEMIKSMNDVIALKDPVGEITQAWTVPNGLKIGRMRMPLGVVGFIFEARPNVCTEAASLTIKSGNAIILRGGSDAINSNIIITQLIREGIKKAGVPEGAVEVIDNTDRESITHMVKLKEYIDVIIPRGGKGLIKFIEENSLIPVIRHDEGICHTFVDETADIDMAVKICYNAKVQRPAVCNAMETMLVHKNIARKFLPYVYEEFKKAKVEIRGDEETKKILKDIKDATEEDWSTEYLDLILSVKVVGSLDEAISHINRYGSHHSDAIVTQDYTNAMRFLNEVDSAACFVNASTRFTDGNQFGLGAEMGISNQKLHVRGPMALRELTSEKYIIFGNGQIRE